MNRRNFFTKFLALAPSISLANYLGGNKKGASPNYIEVLECRPVVAPSRAYSSTTLFFKDYYLEHGTKCRNQMLDQGIIVSKKVSLTSDKMGVIITNVYSSYEAYLIAKKRFSESKSQNMDINKQLKFKTIS